MLADRPYMRRPASGHYWSMTVALIVLNVIAFFVQAAMGQTVSGRRFIATYFALSPEGLASGYIWQLITFQFLHGGLGHLLINQLIIYMFGRAVEQRLGRVTFVKLYLLSGLVGGLVQVVGAFFAPAALGGSLVGASAGASGLIVAYAMLEPNGLVLLYFIIPLRAKYLAIGAAVIESLLLLNSLQSTDYGGIRVAHAAHLGGMATAFAYFRWGMRAEEAFWSRRARRARFHPKELVRVRSAKNQPWPSKSEQQEPSSPDFISREVDPILDKILAHGFQSLTPREREILDAARARMEKR